MILVSKITSSSTTLMESLPLLYFPPHSHLLFPRPGVLIMLMWQSEETRTQIQNNLTGNREIAVMCALCLELQVASASIQTNRATRETIYNFTLHCQAMETLTTHQKFFKHILFDNMCVHACGFHVIKHTPLSCQNKQL